MPKTVDHLKRRAWIVESLVRVAGREGLHAVTMRAVAAEAGISLRLVQYYFESKAQLMHAALGDLERQSNERWARRLGQLPDARSPRSFVEAFLAEALPDDEQSRVFHMVFNAYAVLAMTDPALAEQPFVDGPRRLERELAEVLRSAQDSGELPAGLDPSAEAASLLAITNGLGTSVLVGMRSAAAAKSVLGHHLDRLFGDAPRSAATTVEAQASSRV